MRRIYLIRHSQPDFSEDKKMCIGSTDLPLGIVGRMQSVLLEEGLKEKEISGVYCSHLKRSLETASFLTEMPKQLPEFRELDCGEWDGLTFEEIRKRWPEIYRLRGEDLSYQIPDSEPLEEGKERFEEGLEKVLSESSGSIAIVGHATVLRLFICSLLGIDLKLHRTIPMDYASVTTICYQKEFEDIFKIEKQNERFVPELTEELCRKLLNAAKTPEHVQKHCFAVYQQAKRICGALRAAGILLDEDLIYGAAMLHDIARAQKEHAKTGGQWIKKTGYPVHGELVAVHHEIYSETEKIDEKAVLIMADCTVKETEVVSIEQRFAKSREKCKTEEARKIHEQRYQNAICLRNRINNICGKEILL